MTSTIFRILVLACTTLAFGCGDAPMNAGDAGPDTGPLTACTVDGDCADGLFCTGSERCMPAASDADGRGCVAGANPCETGKTCDEGTDACVDECADFDGDGFTDVECGGADCDDRDERRFPGNPEVCDDDGVDEDCDTSTLGPDGDSDNYVSDDCCNYLETGRLVCGEDCDDAISGVNPGAVDTCGSSDQDCDDEIDENPDTVFYRDIDGDGFGVATSTILACAATTGYAVLPGDCDDAIGGVNPGVGELCNLRDDNCDGSTDEDCDCAPEGISEMCGETEEGSCRLGNRTCVAGVWSSCSGLILPATEQCDGVDDDDCDGVVDNGCDCITGNSRTCGTNVGVCRSVIQTCSAAGQWPRDCADEVGVVAPSAEVCDGVQDENCDGGIDEGCACVNGTVDRSACGTDAGECVSGMRVCTAGAWGSCSGGSGPSTEVCEGSRDENCDGATDENCGCVNGATQPCGVGACLSTRTCVGGTWGACMGLSPSSEACNGVDNDCDGLADSSDPDTVSVGAECGSSTGLCTLGAYSCPGSSLVCSGVAPASEVCDHRDQDCNGSLDDGVSASTCTFSSSAANGASFRTEFTCSWGCFSDSAGKIYNFASGSSSATRIAALTPGAQLPDWGSRFLVRAAFDLSGLTADYGQGSVGVFIAPSATPSTGSNSTMGLPLLSGTQYGFGAIYHPLLNEAQIWEMTPGGNVRRARGNVALGLACQVDDTTLRRYTITLQSNGEAITATVSASGCTTSTATYTATNWQQAFYGDDESAAFPRYQIGALTWNSSNLVSQLQSFTATRTATTTRGNCVGCLW